MSDPFDDQVEPSPYEDVLDDVELDEVDETQFASMTIMELLAEFFRSPLATWQRLIEFVEIVAVDRHIGETIEQVAEQSRNSDRNQSTDSVSHERASYTPRFELGTSDSHRPLVAETNAVEDTQDTEREIADAILNADSDTFSLAAENALNIVVDKWIVSSVVFQVLAFVTALIGCYLLVNGERRFEDVQLSRGLPYLGVSFVIWMIGAALAGQSALSLWSFDQDTSTFDSSQNQKQDPSMLLMRVAFFTMSAILAFVTWTDTGLRQGRINQFRFIGFWAWVGSIVLITMTFAPPDWQPKRLIHLLRNWLLSLRLNRTLIALIVIVLIGSAFRLYNLDGVPPEMTSDHMEKILDSQRVVDGARDVFFANNGGREPFQMYAMALLSQVPGLGMNFTTLKFLAVLEGVFTLPILWWMGREVIGQNRPSLGNVVGLILAALVATSYWHVAITRLALRIVLTPLMGSLLIIFLSRSMRHDRRGDYVIVGLLLGFSFYTYQATRMFPVVVVAGVGIAIVFQLRRIAQIRQSLLHLGMITVISFVIFVPMFRYSIDFPDQFWMRTSGRLFGDNLIIEENENGQRIPREATFDERLQAFQDNLPVLSSNIRNALLMFHWKGDIAWINALPNQPAFDPFSGALLMLGLAAWLALISRYRDPVHVLIPVMVLIMILPSALSIAAPMENPSATRMSGSLPPVYLITALPLGVFALIIWKVSRSSLLGMGVAGGSVLLVLSGSLLVNTDTYFNGYRDSYVRSWTSHRIPADILRGFAQTEGGYGNAFIVGYEHWLDHRIVAIESGAMEWANAIADPNDRVTGVKAVPDFLNDAWYCPNLNYPYHIDPERSLLFFYKGQDEEAAQLLVEWFPDGFSSWVDVEREGDDFYVYRIPALGQDAFTEWLKRNTVNPRCPA